MSAIELQMMVWRRQTPMRVLVIALFAAAAALAGCAPDTITNRQATGFDGYLKTLQHNCPNLEIGSYDISEGLAYNAMDQNFNYWLDMTSKLYYNQTSPSQYRNDVSSFLGDGSSNAQSFDCIIGNLPASRPNRPPLLNID